MKLLIVILVIIATMSVTGCDKFMNTVTDTVNSVLSDSSGVFKSLEESDSTTSVGGVTLKYSGMTVLKEAFNATDFNVDESVAAINLTGIETKDADLKVSYKEYAPNDVAISIDNTSIKAKTKSGKPFLITGIEGKMPRSLSLNIKVGAGKVILTDMQANAKVILETGAGSISLQGCKIKNLTAKTGAGGITLTDSRIDSMDAKVGAGSITLTNTKVTKRNFETGVGRVIEN